VTPPAGGARDGANALPIGAAIADCIARRDGAPEAREVLRDQLGQVVRSAWISWAREQPAIKDSWLVQWEGLSEPEKEVDRRIGMAVATAVAPDLYGEGLEVGRALSARRGAAADAARGEELAEEWECHRDPCFGVDDSANQRAVGDKMAALLHRLAQPGAGERETLMRPAADVIAGLVRLRPYAVTLVPDDFGWTVNVADGPDGPVRDYGAATLVAALEQALAALKEAPRA